MVELAEMIADLDAESADADRLVAELPAADWGRQTPAAGWTIGHQIAHLAWTDDAARLAITDSEAFNAHLATALAEPYAFVDRGAESYLDEPAALLVRWRDGRGALTAALASVPTGAKIAWYGTAMSPASMVTARIMETWAHALDIADTLGVRRVPTARLRHIAHLGHRTIAYAFMSHDQAPPANPIRFELTAPDGTQWTYGPADAEDVVIGPALDLCLLVTQRRHRSDLALTATGPLADAWLDVAQAFAGPSGDGRPAAPSAEDGPAGPRNPEVPA